MFRRVLVRSRLLFSWRSALVRAPRSFVLALVVLALVVLTLVVSAFAGLARVVLAFVVLLRP